MVCNDTYPWPRECRKLWRFPLLQFTDKVVDNPVVVQRQISTETVHKSIETPQLQDADKVVDVPVVLVAQVPHAHAVEKTVENPQFQIVEKSAEDPQTQTIQGTQTSEKLATAPVCRSTQAEIVEAVEIEVPLPAESASPMSVTEPVLEVPPIVGKIDEIPEIRTDVGTQTSESSGTALVEDTEASLLKTPDSIKAHDQASLKTTRNPNGES